MTSRKEEAPEGIRLVVADVDGAPVTPGKSYNITSTRRLAENYWAFTIASGGPPRGDDLRWRKWNYPNSAPS